MNAATGRVRSATPAFIAEAARLLRAGQLIGLPTETVYGLAGDAESACAVSEIYEVKGRPTGHPLIVHVSDRGAASWWAELDEAAERLVAAFWPGPLTLILKRRADVPSFACGRESTIGLRCPSHPVAQAVLRAFEQAGGHGVAAPSANRFGRISPTRADHVLADLGASIGFILDGGDAEVGLESTIVDLSRALPAVLRPGAISVTQIEQVLGRPVTVGWAGPSASAPAPRVPGSLAAHYAPRTPLRLLSVRALADTLGKSAGIDRVVWSRERPAIAVLHWEAQQRDPAAFAQSLYATMRRLDALGAREILLQAPPSGDAWAAVHDRLQRAQTGSGDPD